jgi:hypothetical protein
VARFYRLVRLVIDLLVLRGRRDRSKDVEILVLRHQLAVLERQISRPRFEPEDRAVLTALARVFGRDRWSIFLVRADTILGWHRRLVANHWTYPHRPGRPFTAVETRGVLVETWDFWALAFDRSASGAGSPSWASLRRPESNPRTGGHLSTVNCRRTRPTRVSRGSAMSRFSLTNTRDFSWRMPATTRTHSTSV